MPTVHCYHTNGRGHSFDVDGDTFSVQHVAFEAPWQPHADIYAKDGAFYPHEIVGSAPNHNRPFITVRESPSGITYTPEPHPEHQYEGTITYPDEEEWYGAKIEALLIRDINYLGSAKMRTRFLAEAPTIRLYNAERQGRNYTVELLVKVQGGTVTHPVRLARVEYEIGGSVHQATVDSTNFLTPAISWWLPEYFTRGKITLTYSAQEDNEWGPLRFRAVDNFGQVGGWLTVRIPPYPDYTLDKTRSPVIKLDATPSFSVDSSVVEYSVDLQEWQESPLFDIDFTLLTDIVADPFVPVPIELFVKDERGFIARSGTHSEPLQGRTPRFDSIFNGHNLYYRAVHINAGSYFEPGIYSVVLQIREEPWRGFRTIQYLDYHVDPSLTIDRSTGMVYCLARDMKDQTHKLYVAEHIKTVSAEEFYMLGTAWDEGFSGGRIVHCGGLGFRSAALKRLEGNVVEVWVRGSLDGITWPDEDSTVPEEEPLRPRLVQTFQPDNDVYNRDGRLINLGQLQDGSGLLFLDNGANWFRKSTDGINWVEFTQPPTTP